MPENPEREGSPRLLTVPEIVEKHGISRQTIHAYRQRGVFPQPAPEQGGSTRLRFREDEVDAFVAANPKRPGGRPRADRETATEGEPVTDLSAYQELMTALATRPPRQSAAEDERIVTAALNKHAHQLADRARAGIAQFEEHVGGFQYANEMREIIDVVDPTVPDPEGWDF